MSWMEVNFQVQVVFYQERDSVYNRERVLTLGRKVTVHNMSNEACWNGHSWHYGRDFYAEIVILEILDETLAFKYLKFINSTSICFSNYLNEKTFEIFWCYKFFMFFVRSSAISVWYSNQNNLGLLLLLLQLSFLVK